MIFSRVAEVGRKLH